MFNEGKEIVEYLEKNREQIQSSSYYPNDVLTCKDLIKLMNYIILLEAEVDSRTNFYKNTKELYLKTLDRVKQQAKENRHLCEKEELHLNRIDELTDRVVKLETNIDEAYKLLDDIDEYMLVEQHLKLVEAKKLLERDNSNE